MARLHETLSQAPIVGDIRGRGCMFGVEIVSDRDSRTPDPDRAERTVAEGAFLLMLALRRKLQPLLRTMNTKGWTWPEERWLGNDIAGMTLGLLGFGRIGQAMAQMAGALLINISRGELVEEPSLLKALDSGDLGGAGLDVYAKEPLPRDHPLFDRPNVVLLPHLTFWTDEAMKRLEDDTYARIAELIEGRPVTDRSSDPRLHDQPGARYPDSPLPQ